VGDWVSTIFFSVLLYACTTSYNFLKAVSVLVFLTLLINCELNRRAIIGISMSLTTLNTPSLSRPMSSFWREA
jgi:hypothetical protein